MNARCVDAAFLAARSDHHRKGRKGVERIFGGKILKPPEEVREMQLAHGLDPVKGSYRRETAIEERRAALIRYADGLMGKSNVVPFQAMGEAA